MVGYHPEKFGRHKNFDSEVFILSHDLRGTRDSRAM